MSNSTSRDPRIPGEGGVREACQTEARTVTDAADLPSPPKEPSFRAHQFVPPSSHQPLLLSLMGRGKTLGDHHKCRRAQPLFLSNPTTSPTFLPSPYWPCTPFPKGTTENSNTFNTVFCVLFQINTCHRVGKALPSTDIKKESVSKRLMGLIT